MRISSLESQRRFFARAHKQYKPELVLNPPHHTAREIELVLDAMGLAPGDGSVADFGAGTGRLSFPLLQRGHDVLAVDISEESLHRLRGLAAATPGSLTTAPVLPDAGSLGAIVGTDILHHVELDEHLPRVRDALKPSGRVVVSEPGGLNPLWYVYLPLLGWEVERGVTNMRVGRLTRLFEKHGFVEVRLTGIGLLPRPLFNPIPPLCRLNDAAGNLPLARRFAYRYLVEARRGS